MLIKYTQEQTFKKEVGGVYQFINLLLHTSPLHIHDYFEVFFVLKGKVRHVINSEEHILPAGSLVFIRPEDCHLVVPFDTNECEIINLCFSEEILNKILNFYDNKLDIDKILNSKIPVTIHLAKSEQVILHQKFDTLNVLNPTDANTYHMKLLYLLNDLIVSSFFGNFFSIQKTKQSLPAWLSDLCLEMKKPANFIAGTKRMEELCFLSKEHICRSFAKYLNTSPSKYITDLRMHYAANLLNNSNISIMEISFSCGYSSLSHFYHLFKKYYGVSPSTFREQNTFRTLL